MTQAQGAPVTVSLVQGNIAQDLKWDATRYAATVQLYRRMIERSAARLTILPETAIPRFLDLLDPELVRALELSARSHGGDLIIGLPLRDAPDAISTACSASAPRPPNATTRSTWCRSESSFRPFSAGSCRC